MSNPSDFVIENGVLTRYKGPGGDVEIPDNVTCIGNSAFFSYRSLTGVTMKEDVKCIDDKAFIWDNFYDEESAINQYDITFFTKEKDSDLFKRFSETHLQRGYTLNEMKKYIKKAGLEFVRAFDVDTNGEVTKTSERIAVIARESGK